MDIDNARGGVKQEADSKPPAAPPLSVNAELAKNLRRCADRIEAEHGRVTRVVFEKEDPLEYGAAHWVGRWSVVYE